MHACRTPRTVSTCSSLRSALKSLLWSSALPSPAANLGRLCSMLPKPPKDSGLWLALASPTCAHMPAHVSSATRHLMLASAYLRACAGMCQLLTSAIRCPLMTPNPCLAENPPLRYHRMYWPAQHLGHENSTAPHRARPPQQSEISGQACKQPSSSVWTSFILQDRGYYKSQYSIPCATSCKGKTRSISRMRSNWGCKMKEISNQTNKHPPHIVWTTLQELTLTKSCQTLQG